MHTVFANSLSAVLLLHAVLGCCWHHAHASPPSDRAADELVLVEACCHEHQHASPCDQETPAPCPCHDECDVTCVYLPPQKSQLDCDAASLPFSTPAICTVSTAADVSAVSVERDRYCSVSIEPPVRLHLAHHVLLI